jgi:hypothetical protein
LTRLQDELISSRKRCPVIAGTGGARKLRFSPSGWPVGKRGALRVVFCDLGKFVVLAIVYLKGTKDNISSEDKKAIRKAISDIEEELRR